MTAKLLCTEALNAGNDRLRAILGSLLGTAVGDALGLPYEGLSPARAKRLLGLPDRYRFFLGRGMVSDDTEHTCIVAQSLVAAGDDDKAFECELARRLRNWLRLMPASVGLATLRACCKLNLGFKPSRSGVWSAGNGPTMRAAILGASVDDIDTLRQRVTIAARITHTDPRAAHGALAVAFAARLAARRQLADALQLFKLMRENCHPDKPRELMSLLESASSSAARGESTFDFAHSIGLDHGVTGYVNHTVPVVLHASWRYPSDFSAAVREVIGCGGDTDTTAAITGGIVGAEVGAEGIPTAWLDGLCEWPATVAWMTELACRLDRSRSKDGGAAGNISLNLPRPAIAVRNAGFAGVVLFHGLRRLLPPY